MHASIYMILVLKLTFPLYPKTGAWHISILLIYHDWSDNLSILLIYHDRSFDLSILLIYHDQLDDLSIVLIYHDWLDNLLILLIYHDRSYSLPWLIGWSIDPIDLSWSIEWSIDLIDLSWLIGWSIDHDRVWSIILDTVKVQSNVRSILISISLIDHDRMLRYICDICDICNICETISGIQNEFKRSAALYLQMVAFFFSKSSCFPLPWYISLSVPLYVYVVCLFLWVRVFNSYWLGFAEYGMECSGFMRGN
jgi:hypothetical protein